MPEEARRAPVTRREVKEVLEREGLAPRRRLGQNFLVRRDLLEKIADLALIERGEVVLEVGPGLGGLTERLLARGALVVACEIDRGLAAALPRILGSPPALRVIQGDVMAGKAALSAEIPALLRDLTDESGHRAWKIVSNLPYGISSPFVAALTARATAGWSRAVVLLQREVAAVLRAQPGSGDYSPLSFLAALYLDVGRGPRLPPDCFHPKPLVDSEAVVLTPGNRARVPPDELLPFARRLFQTRRKALRGSVPKALVDCGVPPAGRDRLEELFESAGIRGSDRIDGVAPEAIEGLFMAARGAD